MTRTAVSFNSPERNRSNAVLASSKENVSVFVITGTRAAMSKNSSPSWRVRSATELVNHRCRACAHLWFCERTDNRSGRRKAAVQPQHRYSGQANENKIEHRHK